MNVLFKTKINEKTRENIESVGLKIVEENKDGYVIQISSGKDKIDFTKYLTEAKQLAMSKIKSEYPKLFEDRKLELNDDMKQNLDMFIESVVSEKEEQSNNIFSKYVNSKVSQIVQEFIEGSAIRLKGDDVYIYDKYVGYIDTNLDDIGGGISFTTADNTYSKEFNEIQDLYKFLQLRYNVKESDSKDTITKTIEEQIEIAKKSKVDNVARFEKWYK
jgi:hypothetical protein